jgi:hypothetical protein
MVIKQLTLTVSALVFTGVHAFGQNSTIAVVDGQPISMTELDAPVGDKLLHLRNEEYAIRLAGLNERVDQLLLSREATRRGVTAAELLQTEVDRRVPPTTEAEARAVIDNAARKQTDGSAKSQPTAPVGLPLIGGRCGLLAIQDRRRRHAWDVKTIFAQTSRRSPAARCARTARR